jgi:hypothetical protein
VASGDILTYGNVTATGNVNAAGYVQTSDIRFKTNIETITKNDALSAIREIQPIKYSLYNKPENSTFGFIAQEIEPLLTNSVSRTTNFIPNIYDYAFISGGNTVKLENKTNLFDICNSLPMKIQIHDDHGKIIIRLVEEIIDEKTMKITEPIHIDDNKRIFIFGQEVSDFRSLNYNSIFTMVTAAVKQIDIEQQEIKQVLKNVAFFQETVTVSNNIHAGLFLRKFVFPNHSKTTKPPIIQAIVNETTPIFTENVFQSKVLNVNVDEDTIRFNFYLFTADHSEFVEDSIFNVGFSIYSSEL